MAQPAFQPRDPWPGASEGFVDAQPAPALAPALAERPDAAARGVVWGVMLSVAGFWAPLGLLAAHLLARP